MFGLHDAFTSGDARIRALLEQYFKVQEFDHSLNVYDPGSKLQVQIRKDPDLSEILDRARGQSSGRGRSAIVHPRYRRNPPRAGSATIPVHAAMSGPLSRAARACASSSDGARTT